MNFSTDQIKAMTSFSAGTPLLEVGQDLWDVNTLRNGPPPNVRMVVLARRRVTYVFPASENDTVSGHRYLLEGGPIHKPMVITDLDLSADISKGFVFLEHAAAMEKAKEQAKAMRQELIDGLKESLRHATEEYKTPIVLTGFDEDGAAAAFHTQN